MKLTYGFHCKSCSMRGLCFLPFWDPQRQLKKHGHRAEFLCCTHRNFIFNCNFFVSPLTDSSASGVFAFFMGKGCPVLIPISTVFKQFSPFLNIFLDKTCFSIHISHSSVNFTLFVLLSHPKFDDRPLFKP